MLIIHVYGCLLDIPKCHEYITHEQNIVNRIVRNGIAWDRTWNDLHIAISIDSIMLKLLATLDTLIVFKPRPVGLSHGLPL